MNADAVQFEKHWRNAIASEIDAYSDDTHPMHGSREVCPRCDIAAVLSVVSGRVRAGFEYIECFACDGMYDGDSFDRCPECGFEN